MATAIAAVALAGCTTPTSTPAPTATPTPAPATPAPTAAPTGDAATVNMTGSDGYTNSIALSKIRARPDAIIAINADGSLKAVIPNESKGAWVGNLILIEIE